MNGVVEDNEPLSIEDVLAAEAKEPPRRHRGDADVDTRGQGPSLAEEKRKNLNKDERGLTDRDNADVQSRGNFYVALNKPGGFVLLRRRHSQRNVLSRRHPGFRQFRRRQRCVARKGGCDRAVKQSDAATPPGRQVGEAAESKPKTHTSIDPKVSALGRFHYLSTVSGGGYIGSWLSAWRSRSDFSTVIFNLTSRPNGPDIEPPEISWLRAYSNYLTPTLGITSADSWAAVAISLRNLILNWLVIIPVVCLALPMVKLIAAVSVWVAHDGDKFYPQYHLPFLFAVFGIGCLMGAQAFRRASGRLVESILTAS